MLKYTTIVLFVLSAILLQRTIAQKDKIGSLETQLSGKIEAINIMQKKINEYSKTEEKTNEIINKLRKKANEDKCYNTILPDYIIEQLQ